MYRFREEVGYESPPLGVGSQDRRSGARSAHRASCAGEQEQIWSGPAQRRYRVGFITRSSAEQRLNCKSPSTDSTTSLAQLREKLSRLPSLVFTKVPVKIAATPELPMLQEEDIERLSSSEPRPRCGVALKKQYHSDSEAQTGTKRTRRFTPVVQEHSASLNLVAAQGTTDQSVTGQAFDQLYRNIPKADLADLLVEEALNHGQDKDSGIISGKVTQDSDIVENTPAEEPARRKRLCLKRTPKYIDEICYTTDDSDVVDDTPCYDYDWRKRVRTKNDKANRNNISEIETLNDEAADAYFCKQININCVDLISPGTVKKIHEALSKGEDSQHDCIATDGVEIVEEEEEDCVIIDVVENSAVDADIVDCVNDLLDKVCYDINNCVDILAKQPQHIDILPAVQNIDNRSNKLKMNKDTSKSATDKSEYDTDDDKKVTLKFKPKKQASKLNTKRQRKAKNVKHPITVEKESELKENTNTTYPSSATKQLIRKKRKLYSPKDEDDKINDIPSSRKRTPSSSTESPIAACYKELEHARKSRIRLPKKRASGQPVISPNTKRLNDIFDEIKDNVVNNEKVTLVDKKSKNDLSIYNLSSESDEGAFQKKKIQVQKRISSSSLESSSKRRRSVKPVNYNYSSEDECPKVLKPRAAKQAKSRSGKMKKIEKYNLIDERMRKTQPEVLDTSFVHDKGDTNIPEEPEPALHVPVLETIPPDDTPIVSESKRRTPKKSETINIKTEKNLRNKCEKLSKRIVTNKSKEIVTNVATEKDSATLSPLPGLVVETEPRKDDLTSSMEAALLQKLKQIYTDVDNLSTTRDTQNLLVSNNDGIEFDVLSKSGDNQTWSINLEKNEVAPIENLHAQNLSNVTSEKSIATGGRSPITGHNDLDESPPNLDALYESFQHRDVDVEGRSRDVAECIVNMRNQWLNGKAAANRTSPIIPITRISTKNSTRSNLCVKKSGSNQKQITSSEIGSDRSNPRVKLERMSSEYIEYILNRTPQSKVGMSRVSTGMSSKEIEKSVTQPSTVSSDLVVVLDRISSDEINKWLPMPATTTTQIIDEGPSKPRRVTPRRKSIAKPCITCYNHKPTISPVKLSFDIGDVTGRVTRSRTRSIESMKSHTNIRTENKSVAKPEVNVEDVGNIETVFKSVESANMSKDKAVESRVDPSEMKKSVASVQDWISKNAATSAGSSKTDGNAITKEGLLQVVMEALDTRLVDINETTGEAMQAAFMKDREELARLREEIDRMQAAFVKAQEELLARRVDEVNRMQAAFVKAQEELLARRVDEVNSLKAKIHAIQKSKMDRACALIRTDAENKARMVRLLKEDIEMLLK